MIIYYGNSKYSSQHLVLDELDLNLPFGTIACEQTPSSLLNSIEQTEINGKKVYQHFDFDSISLWWNMHPTIFPPFCKIINFIEKFQEILVEKKPTKLYLIGEFDKFDLIKQLCKNNNIEFSYSKIRLAKFLILKNSKAKIHQTYLQRETNKKNKKRINLFKNTKKNLPTLENKIILFEATAYWRTIHDLETGKLFKGEHLLHPIITLIKKMDLHTVGIDCDYTLKGNSTVLKERLEDSYPWVPIEYIIEKYTKKNEYEEFIKKYVKLIHDYSFQNLFTFKGVNLWPSLKQTFEMLSYLPYLPMYILTQRAMTKLLQKNKPKAVMMLYEQGPYSLAAITASTKNNIKSIGIQHGYILPKDRDYTHSEIQSDTNSLAMIIPDLTLLWGNFAKQKILQEGPYQEEKFVVFGNPLFFNLEKLLDILKTKDLKSQYKIPKNKKIILMTTGKNQSHYNFYGKRDYDERVVEKLFESFGNEEKYHIVLKPHPIGEPVTVYENLAKKYNIKNFQIVQGNVLEILYLADVVVATFSTAITDAIALGKFGVLVTFKEGTISLPFKEYGVLLECENNSLKDNVEKCLFDPITQKKLKSNRHSFIREQYNIPNENVFEQLSSILGNK